MNRYLYHWRICPRPRTKIFSRLFEIRRKIVPELKNELMKGLTYLMKPVADLRGAPPARDPPPYGPKFSQFHAVFRKNWQNCMLVPLPPEGWRPLLRGILDPPLETINVPLRINLQSKRDL